MTNSGSAGGYGGLIEAIAIPGSRPAGVFTAGVVQNLVNIKNIMVGRQVVILGSGDIGLILVMHEGRVTGIVDNTKGLTQHALMEYATARKVDVAH